MNTPHGLAPWKCSPQRYHTEIVGVGARVRVKKGIRRTFLRPISPRAETAALLMANANSNDSDQFRQAWYDRFTLSAQTSLPVLMRSLLANKERRDRTDYGTSAVVVGQSSIDGAGNGLFACVNIKRGEMVTCMKIPVIVGSVSGIVEQGHPHDSVVHAKKGEIIFDAAFTTADGNIPKWYKLNHSKRRLNLRMQSAPDKVTPRVSEFRRASVWPEWRATRNIDAGEELFFDYGVTPVEWK